MSYDKKRWTCFSVSCPKTYTRLKELKCLIDQYAVGTTAEFTDIFISESRIYGETLAYCSIYSTEEQWWRFFDILKGECNFRIKGWYDAGPSHTGGYSRRR